jgi:hypothetical protein
MKLRAALISIDAQDQVTEAAPDTMFELIDRTTGAVEQLVYDEFVLQPPFMWDGKSITLKYSLCATDSKGEKHVHPTYRDFSLTLTEKIYPDRWADWRDRPPTLDEIQQLLQDTNLLSAETGRRWDLPLQTKLISDAGETVSDFAAVRMREAQARIIEPGEKAV